MENDCKAPDPILYAAARYTLLDAWGTHEKGSLFAQVVENAWEKSRANSLSRSTDEYSFFYRIFEVSNAI
jgi:hypothetical protein